MKALTKRQETMVAILERAGFYTSAVRDYDGEKAPTVFMTRDRGCSHHYAQVDPDASVNGTFDVRNFLASFKRR